MPAGSPAAATVVPVPVPPRTGPAAGNAPPGPPTSAGPASTGGAAVGAPGGAATGSATGVPGGVPGGAPSPGPGGVAAPGGAQPRPLILPNLSDLPGPYRVQPRRSLADMANEQLRRGKPRDPLADGMRDAGRPDCTRAPTTTTTVGGLLAAPGLAARALSGDCPK